MRSVFGRTLSTSALTLLVAACGGANVGGHEVATVGQTVLSWDASSGERLKGSLAEGDTSNEDGHLVDLYATTFLRGSTVRLAIDSAEFDTVIRVHGPDGLELFNDDFGAGTNSMVQFQVNSDQPHMVEVTGYSPDAAGQYSLSATVFSPSDIGPTMLLGDSRESEVAEGNAGPGIDGATGSVWFEARAGQRVRLRVTSADFDTVATLFAPTGQSWFNDDANDMGPDGTESNYDSTIEAIAPDDGWYQLVVSPYGGEMAGAFNIVTTYREPIMVGADEEIPSSGYAGTEADGRMYGIYAGITDYGPGDQLYGCADDATFLADAFRHRRLQSRADQVIMRDQEATSERFIAAVRRVADKAGPDDVVVIFYSGHGGILPVDAAADHVELDGSDETLVFSDRQMTDNEFAELMDLFRVNTLILAIDSCQSGGFARDFMTRPGRIGIFSSDEDVLSSTAEPVGAGGYLSYMMREAVLGHADSRPGDGAMLAGEFTDFMLEMAVEYHREMNPEGSNDPIQRILIERGSYGWADLLWVFPRAEDGEELTGDICLDSGPVGGAPMGGSCR